MISMVTGACGMCTTTALLENAELKKSDRETGLNLSLGPEKIVNIT